MLIPILIILGAILILFIVIVAMQPAAFRIERSTTIAAPPAVVFPFVNDFHNWIAWSPWEKIDSTMTKTFDGPASGTGAKYSWSGNKKVGEGRMTILESRANEIIRIKLEFLKPFVATNTAEFTFVPEGTQTRIVWAMTGQNNFMMKGFNLLMNMDKLVGGDFEKGLASMKAAVEGVNA
ncbi:MAG: SRPBCC family protein [Planctomycetaceae bacterium]